MSTKNSDLQPLPAGLTYCRKCENTKPTELFVLSTLSKSKQKGVCKACWADYVKGRREARDLSKSISTADLSKDVIALHAFAGQIVAAVKELAHVSPEAWNLALGLEATHAALEANLACVRVDRLAKGLPPLPLPKALPEENEALPGDSGASKNLSFVSENEFQAVGDANKQGFSEFVAEAGKRKITEVITEIQADLDPVPQRASLVRGELMAEHVPVPLQDLPDGATEDNYARAHLLAEDHREANAQDLPTPETEIPLGANKVVTDLDPSKEEF